MNEELLTMHHILNQRMPSKEVVIQLMRMMIAPRTVHCALDTVLCDHRQSGWEYCSGV